MKNKIKLVSIVMCLVLVAFTLTGCMFFEKEEVVDTGFMVSFLNRDMTKTIKKPYELKAPKEDVIAGVREVLGVMGGETKDVEIVRAIPAGVEVLDIDLESNGRLNLYFDEGYTNIDSVQEILCRLALVQTLTQFEGVYSIFIYVDGKALCDAKGYIVGAMTVDSFVENPGEQIDSIQSAKLTLYFSDRAGDGLVAETQTVHYSSNTSLEKLVVERLIKGPVSSNALATLPEGTTLVNASVADRICYVSFNEAFKNQNYDIKEETVIYSIVNSLTNLGHIDKVQILVNGDSSGVYRDKYQLSEFYEFNGSMIEKTHTVDEVILENDPEETSE